MSEYADISRWPPAVSAMILDALRARLYEYEIGIGTCGDSGGRSAELRCPESEQTWVRADEVIFRAGEGHFRGTIPAGAHAGLAVREVALRARDAKRDGATVYIYRWTTNGPVRDGGAPCPVRVNLVP